METTYRPDVDRPRQLARARALRRLAAEFSARFDELHDEERVKVGLPPVQRRTSDLASV